MSQGSYPNAQSIQQHQFENGIKLLMYRNPASDLVVVRGSMAAGGIGEPREKAGLADFAMQMLMRGTQARPFEQIYDDLESVGASLGFSGGYRRSGFGAEALIEDLDLVLDLAAESILRPTFPADHIEKVRAENMTGLQMRANDTRSMANLRFREMLYPDHPYGQSADGYPDSISQITQDDLIAYHRTALAPDGMVIVVVGNIDFAAVQAQVAAHFGAWRNPDYVAPIAYPDAARPAETVRVHVDMPEKTQSDIVLGLPGPRRNDPHFMDVRLANTILGVFGMMGRLGQNVRVKQGLAYYANSRLSSSMGPYPWQVNTGVSPDKVEQAINSILDEIKRIQNVPVPASELADSQAYMTGSLPLSLETNGGLASVIMSMETLQLGFDYLDKYADNVNAVTPAQVQKAAQTYFSAEEIVIAVAGPPPA